MAHEWLVSALKAMPLTEEVETYLLGRGVKESTIRAEGMKTWQLLCEPSPDPTFVRKCGPHGERLDGMLIVPVRSPTGKLLGFEARSIHEKRIIDYRLPAAKWTPFFIGTRNAMPALWAGRDVWLGEGLFDMAALEWVVPPGDAVLATVRAHLTPQQVEFLRRFCRGTVRVVFDRDETGRKAVTGWVDETGQKRVGVLQKLRRVGVDAVAVNYHYRDCKDPGDVWDKGGEPALREAFMENVYG